MKKISNHNTKEEKDAKKGTEEKPIKQLVFGEYFNIHTFLNHPITMSFIDAQCRLLREWAKSEEALVMYDFIDEQGYSPHIFYEWCNKYPQLQAAHEYAIRRVGARREKGAMTRKFSEATVHRTLGYYNHIWQQSTIEMMKMKEKLAQAEQKIIVLEKFPSPEEIIEHTDLPDNPEPEKIASLVHKRTVSNVGIGIESAKTKHHNNKSKER